MEIKPNITGWAVCPIPSGAEAHVYKAGTYRSCQAPRSRAKARGMVERWHETGVGQHIHGFRVVIQVHCHWRSSTLLDWEENYCLKHYCHYGPIWTFFSLLIMGFLQMVPCIGEQQICFPSFVHVEHLAFGGCKTDTSRFSFIYPTLFGYPFDPISSNPLSPGIPHV